MKPLFALFLVGLAVQPAFAGSLEEAKAAFADGKAAYERGDYERALAQFQRANLIQPAPSLSFNIGKTYEHLGRYREAVATFEQYLQLAGAPQTPEETKFQQDLRVRIAALRVRPDAAQMAQQPPPPQEMQQQPPQAQNPQYNPYYYQPYAQQPYYYGQQPYAQPPLQLMTREQRIADGRRRRATGMGLTISGIIIEVIGIAMTADGSIRGNSVTIDNIGPAVEVAFGVIFDLAGIALVIPGAVIWGKADADLKTASAMPAPPPPPAIPGQPMSGYTPTSFLFHAPAIRF